MNHLVPLVLCGSALYAFQSPGTETPKLSAIEGRVVDAQSGEPVRKAIVVLREGKEPGTGTLSDAAGRFNFRDIPPAAYTFTIERQGFVTDP